MKFLKFAVLSSVFCLILCFLLRFLVNSPEDSVEYTIRTDIIGVVFTFFITNIPCVIYLLIIQATQKKSNNIIFFIIQNLVVSISLVLGIAKAL
jgi:hypothetical protein